MRRALSTLGAGALIVCGCSGSPEDPSVVAVVGEVHITAADLRAFQENLPPSYRRAKDEKEARAPDLQTLIDRQLMELDARSRRLGQDPRVLQKLKESEDEKLVDEMISRKIRARVTLSEDEVASEYEEKGWHEQVETLELFVPTRGKADEVMGLLNGGADFGEAARTHSVDRALKVPTGSTESFTYSPHDRPRAVVEAVFSLPPGSITEPVSVMGGFVLAKVVERRQVELDEVRNRVEQEVVTKKKKLLRSVYLIELRNQFSLEFHQEGMDLVMRALRGEASLSEDQRAAVVYTYEGGVLTVQGALEAVRRVRLEWPQTEERFVTAHLKEHTLPDRLMALDARERGMDRETEFQEWRERKTRDLMVAQLRSLVLENLTITREDLEQYHRANRDRYTNPDRARVQDLLVEDRARAQELRQQIEAGADMAALINEHSIRQTPRDGKLSVSSPQVPFYGEEWIKAVMEAPLNEVRGPVQTRGGYSIFRVYERYPEELFPLQGKVLRLVRRAVTEEKEREVFVQYLQDLRQRYDDRVHVYPERLEQL